MKKEIFNPKWVKYTAPSMPKADYSEVSDDSLGIIFYDDGNIMYIGEMTDNLPDGYGEAFYCSNERTNTMARGNFEAGTFISGDHYDNDGNINDIADVQKMNFEGKCVFVNFPSK